MTEQNQATDITADDAEGHFRRGTHTESYPHKGADADDTQGHACPRVVDADDDDVQAHR